MTKADTSLFSSKIKDHTIITGGHFMILEDGSPNLNTGTIESFENAVEAYVQARGNDKQVGLGILVNNMGGVCDAKKQVCTIDPEKAKEIFSLPDEYKEILTNHNIDEQDVVVFWEKSLRNKGKKEMLKKIKEEYEHIELSEGAYWFVNPEDGRKITLSRPNPNDKYGIAACPLIMAAYAQQMKRRGFDSSLNFYYVDLANEDNIPNYFAIEKGRVVAEHFYSGTDIMNVYLLEDKVVTSFDLGKV